MRDCKICFSAGSVNRYGYCEVCGEDHEESARVQWGEHTEVEFGTRFKVIAGGAVEVEDAALPTDIDQLTAS